MDLALDDQRVDRLADVVDARVARDLERAVSGSTSTSHTAAPVGCAGQAPGKRRLADQRRALGKLEQAEPRPPARRARYDAVVATRRLLPGRPAARPPARARAAWSSAQASTSRLPTRRIDRSECVPPPAVTPVGVAADQAHLLGRDAQQVGDDLGKRRRVALAASTGCRRRPRPGPSASDRQLDALVGRADRRLDVVGHADARQAAALAAAARRAGEASPVGQLERRAAGWPAKSPLS